MVEPTELEPQQAEMSHPFESDTLFQDIEYYMNKCKYCGREIKNKGSLVAHEICCQFNPNRKSHPRSHGAGRKVGIPAWNRGLTLVDAVKQGIITEESRQKILSGSRKGGSIAGGKGSTPLKESERKKKISETMKRNPNAGGKRHGSGRGKKGWYKGYWCDSSWELAYVIYNIDHNIQFDRNTEEFEYLYQENKHVYIPDFIEDGFFIEIKGYKHDQWMSKLDQFKYPIKVLYKKEMEIYLNYAISKYGKNYISLYEKESNMLK